MRHIRTDSGVALQPFLLTPPRSLADWRRHDDLKRYIADRLQHVAAVAPPKKEGESDAR